MNRLLLGCLALAMIPGVAFAQAQPATGPCDRACLVGFIDQYLDALVAQDPKRLPVTPDVKFTENGQRLTLGDGFWNSVTGKGTYRVDVADPAAGQVGDVRDHARGARDAADHGAAAEGGEPAPDRDRGAARTLRRRRQESRDDRQAARGIPS